MELTRRGVLVGAGTSISAAIAGCGGGGGQETPQETDEPEATATTAESTATATPTPGAETFADEEVSLPVGQYKSFRVYHDSEFRLSYEFEVLSGPSIDVFVLKHRQLSRYESEKLFDIAGSTLNADSGSEEFELSSGTYHVVVDNTSAGEAEPRSGINQAEEAVEVQIRATSELLS